MYLLGLGLLLLALKFLALGPVATWSWWLVLAPFGLAVLWWAWADAYGYTRRQVMRREQARRQARIDRQRQAQGGVEALFEVLAMALAADRLDHEGAEIPLQGGLADFDILGGGGAGTGTQQAEQQR